MILSILTIAVWILASAQAAALHPQIPSVESFSPAQGLNAFQLLGSILISVDSRFAKEGSPSLLDFANTFRDDLASVASLHAIPPVQVVSQKTIQSRRTPTVYLTLDSTKQYKLFNGNPTTEGYDIDIAHDSVTITAAAPLGAWWGTRTILQQVVMSLSSGAKSAVLPVGHISDSPGWEVRGFMLDAGRHWFEADFMSEFI